MRTCTSPIMQLICPQKFCMIFVFHFFWVLQPSQEKLKAMVVQNFGGQISCILEDMQVGYIILYNLIFAYVVFIISLFFKLFFCFHNLPDDSLVPFVSSVADDDVGSTFSLADKETKKANGRIHKQIVK